MVMYKLWGQASNPGVVNHKPAGSLHTTNHTVRILTTMGIYIYILLYNIIWGIPFALTWSCIWVSYFIAYVRHASVVIFVFQSAMYSIGNIPRTPAILRVLSTRAMGSKLVYISMHERPEEEVGGITVSDPKGVQ